MFFINLRPIKIKRAVKIIEIKKFMFPPKTNIGAVALKLLDTIYSLIYCTIYS